MADKELTSAGHKLGQLVGDWYEEYFVHPLLQKVADHLGLYLDHRFRIRIVRAGNKIIWKDEDENGVNYDFVLELDGTDDKTGIPVAFFECFWRRGARHSKDKARDDSGKLMPMRDVYPTARFLGIVAGGDFTAPARTLVQTRKIDLFYVPKAKIVAAFQQCGLVMDYPDNLAEERKAQLAATFEQGLTPEIKRQSAKALQESIGKASLNTYVDRVRAALGALPQEIRFVAQKQSQPVVFESIPEASKFLENPRFDYSSLDENFIYEVTYSDGSEYERPVETLAELKKLHQAIDRLSQHISSLTKDSKR